MTDPIISESTTDLHNRIDKLQKAVGDTLAELILAHAEAKATDCIISALNTRIVDGDIEVGHLTAEIEKLKGYLNRAAYR